MPEGPEVEIVRQELISLVGRTVKQIRLTELSQNYAKYHQKQELYDFFAYTTLSGITRFGKFLIWRFAEVNSVVLNHLGMSGRWALVNSLHPPPPLYKHLKVIIKMKKPPHAVFDDVRNFGQFKVFESIDQVNNYPPIKKMGIDGLMKPFPLEAFIARLGRSSFLTKLIGEVLVDQRLVAGVGNIYKSEALYVAKIDPRRKVQNLSIDEQTTLGEAISYILHKALESKGSTLDFQPYTRPKGDIGEAQTWHKVYGRAGKSCFSCANKIERIKQNGRSSFFCSKCQT